MWCCYCCLSLFNHTGVSSLIYDIESSMKPPDTAPECIHQIILSFQLYWSVSTVFQSYIRSFPATGEYDWKHFLKSLKTLLLWNATFYFSIHKDNSVSDKCNYKIWGYVRILRNSPVNQGLKWYINKGFGLPQELLKSSLIISKDQLLLVAPLSHFIPSFFLVFT